MADDHTRHRKRKLHHSYSLNTDSIGSVRNYSLPAGECNTQRQHSMSIRKKPETLICSICDGPAHGYNFDAITCESCKAFFRRNALKVNV